MPENPSQGEMALFAADLVVALDHASRLMGFSQAAQVLLGAGTKPGDPFCLERIMKGLSLTEARAVIEKALQGLPTTGIKARMMDSHGKSFRCRYSVHPLLSGAGRVTGVTLIIRDVEYSAAEKEEPPATDPSPFPLGAVFESLPEGIFTIDRQWRITSFNQAAERMTGFTRKEVMGKLCRDVFRSNLCEEGHCPMKQALDTQEAHMDQDVVIVDKGGARLQLLVNVSVLRTSEGTVIGAVESFRCLTDEPRLPRLTGAGGPCSDIIGQSPSMRRLIAMIPDVAASDTTVFLTGESGTGKEVIARAIHALSPRAKGPFVAVNCSAITETLMESEFFGHEKGSFTGADKARAGRFELAAGGTLFLDEIAELKPELQAKLLRVLQEKVFERVGGSRSIPMDARIISATNRDISRVIASRLFREDLYYRLRTVPIHLPPLREKPEDIPLLARHFLRRFNQKYQKDVRAVDTKVMELLQQYPWPGNVRELERVIEYAYVFIRGPVILVRHLPSVDEFVRQEPEPAAAPSRGETEESQAILQILKKTGGRKKEAADLLGMSRTTLWRKMKDLGID